MVNKQSGNIGILDSFKGFAIIGIIMIHMMQWNLNIVPGTFIYNVQTAGLLGVEITYLINSFLFIRSYKAQEIHETKKEASSGSVGRNESLIWQQGRDI